MFTYILWYVYHQLFKKEHYRYVWVHKQYFNKGYPHHGKQIAKIYFKLDYILPYVFANYGFPFSWIIAFLLLPTRQDTFVQMY